MAELSFGHNLRAKRKEVVNNTLTFLPWAQGCLTACAPAKTPFPNCTGARASSGVAAAAEELAARASQQAIAEFGQVRLNSTQRGILAVALRDDDRA